MAIVTTIHASRAAPETLLLQQIPYKERGILQNDDASFLRSSFYLAIVAFDQPLDPVN